VSHGGIAVQNLLQEQVGGDDRAEVAVAPAVAEVPAELLDEGGGNRVGESSLDAGEGVRDTKHSGLWWVVMVVHLSSSQEAALSTRATQGKEKQGLVSYLNGVRARPLFASFPFRVPVAPSPPNVELTGTPRQDALAAKRPASSCASRPGRPAVACPVGRHVRRHCGHIWLAH